MSSKVTKSNTAADTAPVIPHIEANIIPLANILKNYSEESYKELTELLSSTLQSTTTSDAEKKKALLLLLVKLRENFIRLYVLNKWSVNAAEFGKLIDLLNWLRLTIEKISIHSIWGLKNLNASLTSAKLPNPDLITSLEVLLSGRPKLPSYNFLPQPKLSPNVILKTLQNLNVLLAFKLSLLDELPLNFYNYQIKDGKVFFNIDRNYQCCVSIAEDTDDSQFYLLDFKFNFNYKDNSIIYNEEETTSLVKAHQKLETVSNQLLLKNKSNQSAGLVQLNQLLSQYTLNYKLFLLHRQLIAMRAGIWKSQISHTYAADKNVIVVYYWLKLGQHSNKKKHNATGSISTTTTTTTTAAATAASVSSYIEISITESQTMQFKWIKDNELQELLPDFDLTMDELNIENILTNITEQHANMKIMQLYEKISTHCPSAIQLKPSTPSSPTLSLLLQLTSTKNISFSISALSGLLYFINPTHLLASLLPQLNQTLAINPARLHFDLLAVIVKTNFELLDSLLQATEWLPNNLRVPDTSKVVVAASNNGNGNDNDNDDDQLHRLQYYRRRDWPQGWFLISCLQVDSQSSPVHIKWFVARIKLNMGLWIIQWCEELKNLRSSTKNTENIHELLNEISIHARSKLLSELVTKDLESDNAKLRAWDEIQTDQDAVLPIDIQNDDDNSGPILLIKNSSIFNISHCHENLIVKVELNDLNSLTVLVVGKLKDFQINELHESFTKKFETTSLDYSPETMLFQVKSIINGGAIGGGANANANTEINAASIISSSSNSAANAEIKTQLLSSSVEVLTKFSEMLSMLSVLSREQIKINANSLQMIEFEYFGVKAKLNLSMDSIPAIIEFDQQNPHNLLKSQICSFLSKNGFLKTLKILKKSYPIINKLSQLAQQNQDDTTATTTFNLIIHELNFYKILSSTVLIFITVDYNKSTVLIKLNTLAASISSNGSSNTIQSPAIEAMEAKLGTFLNENYPAEKFANKNIFVVDIKKFDEVIDSIYNYLNTDYKS